MNRLYGACLILSLLGVNSAWADAKEPNSITCRGSFSATANPIDEKYFVPSSSSCSPEFEPDLGFKIGLLSHEIQVVCPTMSIYKFLEKATTPGEQVSASFREKDRTRGTIHLTAVTKIGDKEGPFQFTNGGQYFSYFVESYLVKFETKRIGGQWIAGHFPNKGFVVCERVYDFKDQPR